MTVRRVTCVAAAVVGSVVTATLVWGDGEPAGNPPVKTVADNHVANAPLPDDNGGHGPTSRPNGIALMGRFRSLKPPLGPADDPTDEEWKSISTFSTNHLSAQWEAFGRLSEGGPLYTAMKRYLTRRWKGIDGDRTRDPALYAIRVQEAEAEDELFGIAARDRIAAHPHDIPATAMAADEARGTIGKLVDLGFQERAHRIATLETQLATEKQKLQADEANRQSLIDTRLKNFQIAEQIHRGFGSGGRRVPATDPRDVH